LKNRYSFIALQLIAAVALFALASGCHTKTSDPRELLDRYFSSAVKQDYATTYDCYYSAYKAKVSKDEFIKHRQEASVLQSYKIVSLTQNGDNAQAQVLLTFAPSEKLNRKEPVSTTVTENMVKEGGQWKIKVWE
jgi:hypothetical protein